MPGSRRGCLIVLALVLGLVLLLRPEPAAAAYRSPYIAKLVYNDPAVLQEFNDNLRLPRNLAIMARKKPVTNIHEEVLAKLDVMIEKVEVVLDMFPNNMQLTFRLLMDRKGVAGVYLKNYGKKVNHIAYYSLSQDTLYLSAKDASLRVVAHEIGHAIVDHYFNVRPPYNMHELMAQFAEKHISD